MSKSRQPRPSSLISPLRGRRASRERGSAIITVILVILVLTVIGIGVAYLTQVEDRISGNDRLQKAGFYAAEAGLRVGETAIQTVVTNPGVLTLLLSGGGTPLSLPGGGFAAIPLTVTIPGGSVITYTNRPVYGSTTPTGTIPRSVAGLIDDATYSLFIRNNTEDPSGSATTDTDSQINLISVGQVITPTGLGSIQKILEESLTLAIAGAQFGTQKGGNAGGTGGATI